MSEAPDKTKLQSLSNRDTTSDDMSPEERKRFEESLDKTLEDGDIDAITETLSPRALTKCHTNALMKAMEVSFGLRQSAQQKEPDEQEFNKLANSVDEFTSCLLDPMKSKTETRNLNIFRDSLDDIVETAIECEQKKLLAHPILYKLMNDKWLGELSKLSRSSRCSSKYWKWLFLNIWCLFDLVLCPILFIVFKVGHIFRTRARNNKELEVVFVLNATSVVADQAFHLMKDSMKSFISSFGELPYRIIIEGKIIKSIDKLDKGKERRIPALHRDLQRAMDAFESNMVERSAEKVLIVFTDHKLRSRDDPNSVEDQMDGITMKGVKVIPVAIGCHVNLRALEKLNVTGCNVIHCGEYEKPDKVAESILYEIDGKDIYEKYCEYFTTPYIIFVRDTLSYLALLGLHFAICLAPSSLAFSGTEWAILVFFVGRFLLESKQFCNVHVEERKGVLTKTSCGSKYTSCDELAVGDKPGGTDVDKSKTSFLFMFQRYLSDRWNILDFTSLLIYFATFVLRVFTWATSDSMINNRTLVIAGYLYGLNTMFLTFRAFGNLMETMKGVGPIQIALFYILGDVVAIFWQFLATILAFSFVLTKIYVAEKYFIRDGTNGKHLACNASGILCWWTMIKHLCWSLVGIPELEQFDTIDLTTETIVHFLYAAFMIMGVIVLINMMIALLSNTYQRVEDNALKEWSFKKAITIQVYSSHDPVPVPLNLIWDFLLGMLYFCNVCRHCREEQPKGENEEDILKRKSFDAVVKDLQLAYFAKYGYSFPLTDERKLDQVLMETERSREMANQIVHRSFLSREDNQGLPPTGPKEWYSVGIRVEGCLLSCVGADFCPVCIDQQRPFDFHGARYKTAFTPEFPHFEVLIQETGERRFLGVGVVGEDYTLHAMPGWMDGSVGYHVDDGKIVCANNGIKEKELEDAMAYRGDLIGCTVMFEKAVNESVPVVFTLNGRQIHKVDFFIKYGGRFLYPYVAMGHKGIRVLAKLSAGNARSYCQSYNRRDECQRERELVSVRQSFKAVQDESLGVREELSNIGSELRDLRNEVIKSIFEVQNALSGDHNYDTTDGPYRKVSDPDLMLRELASLKEKERNVLQREATSNLLMANPEVETQLEDVLQQESTAAVDTLQKVKLHSKKHSEMIRKMKDLIGQKLSALQDCIHERCNTHKPGQLDVSNACC